MENIHAHAIRRQVELGISIELDPAVAHDLRQQEEKRRRKQRDSRAGAEQPQQHQQQQDDDDNDDDDDDDFDRLVFHYQNEEEEDDWNYVIQTIENAAATTGRETTMIPPGGNEGNDNVGEASTDDEQEEKSDKDEDDTAIPVAVEITDEISLAPDDPMASSLPVVLVNIERLVGYTPSSREQVECLKLQIQSALYGQQPSNDDDNDNEENTDPTTTVTAAATGDGGGGGRTRNYDPDGDTTRCDDDFDTRLVEMFTNKSAHHSDTVRVAKLQQQLQEQQQQQQFSFAVIPYPDLLCRKPPAPHNEDPLEEEAATVVYTTRQIWKSLLKRHVVPVVNRLLQHLRNCSQSLLWKHDLRCEILHLVRSQNRQLQQDKLNAWRGTRRGTRGGGTATGAEAGVGTSGLRREKLEKLYHVREMFVHSLDIAQEHLDTLDQQREVAVQQSLLRLRQSQRTGGHAAIGGVEALDFATTSVLTFPTQQEMNQRLGGMSSSKISNSLIIGLQGDDDDDDVYADYDDAYYDDDYVPISSDDDDDGDDDECDDLSQNSDSLSPMPETTGLLEPDVDGGAATDTVATVETTTAAADEVMTSGVDDDAECVDHFLSERVATRQSRRQAARQRRLQKLATAKEEEYRSKLEAAKKEEERAREACTTQEHKIAMAKVHCFQDRLTSVDNLLESLQEDEWADEETTERKEASGRVSVIGENSGTVDDDKKGSGEDCRDLTLLDQVLITILGSIRVPVGTRAADHAAWLRTEHLEIVADWKKHFGSLPPSLKRLSSPPTGLDEHEVGASSSSPPTSKFDSSVAFQARVAPSVTEATAVRSVEEQASTTQAAWRAGTSSNPQQNVSESRAAHEIRQSLGIEDNEAEDWDA